MEQASINLTLTLPAEAVGVILAGLGELQSKIVGDLPAYIRAQAASQLQAAQAVKPSQPAETPLPPIDPPPATGA